ncbi:MAG: hypothetical protein FWC71_07140 [Defluviitaleaceae bacterium]|nr:hypothetical protein [Defluviitaleaceae bacterium]
MNIEIILTMITAFTAVIVGAVSIYFTLKSIRQQHIHNQNSVMPICNIRLSAISSKTTIIMHNVGTGPMLIKKLMYLSDDGQESRNIKSFMLGKVPSGCTTQSFDSLDVGVGEEIRLLQYKQPDDVSDEDYQTYRLQLLKCLGLLSIYVEYEDIYGNPVKHKKELKFFDNVYKKKAKIQMNDKITND